MAMMAAMMAVIMVAMTAAVAATEASGYLIMVSRGFYKRIFNIGATVTEFWA